MRRHLLIAGLVGVACAAALASACSSGPSAGARARATAAATPSPCGDVQLQDGLDLLVLGSGGPRSAGRAASSHLIGVDGVARILIDAGPGAFVRLGEAKLPAEQLTTVLLTHLHVDHSGDLAALIKSHDLVAKGPVAFHIAGPTGGGLYPSTSAFVERLFARDGAYAYLPTFRHALTFQTVDVDAGLDTKTTVETELPQVAITAVGVDHADVPALAFRIDAKGRSVVITGDLASRTAAVEELARDADVLVYDTAVRDPPGSPANLYTLHTAPRRIGEVAAAARVKLVVLAHIAPAVDEHRAEVLASVRSAFAGEVRLASDCLHIPLGKGEARAP